MDVFGAVIHVLGAAAAFFRAIGKRLRERRVRRKVIAEIEAQTKVRLRKAIAARNRADRHNRDSDRLYEDNGYRRD